MSTNLAAFRGVILTGLLAMLAGACATHSNGANPMSAELTQQTQPATQILRRDRGGLP